MPSDSHQWLVVWLSRLMARNGFDLVGADVCSYRHLLPGRPLASMTIWTVRPDVIGVHRRDRSLAFGEAKTTADLVNPHTLRQLSVMLGVRDSYERRAKVYLAFPSSGYKLAAKTLLSLGLKAAVRVMLVPIPDALLQGRCG